MKKFQNISLLPYNSFRTNCIASCMFIIETVDDVNFLPNTTEKWQIIGNGTNTFFLNEKYEGTIIKTDIKYIKFEDYDGQVVVKAGAGVEWDDLVKSVCDSGLWGLENLSLIPGTVGAAPVQNIGAYGVEQSELFLNCLAFDMLHRKLITFNRDMCKFEYRNSIFKREQGRYVILEVSYMLSRHGEPRLKYKDFADLNISNDLSSIREAVIKIRQYKLPDPKRVANAGSFFLNPIINSKLKQSLTDKFPDLPIYEFGSEFKISAAYLIDKIAHLKGYRVGNCHVHENQALVIVSNGKANGEEIYNFSEKIINKVKELTGVTLTREVNIVKS